MSKRQRKQYSPGIQASPKTRTVTGLALLLLSACTETQRHDVDEAPKADDAPSISAITSVAGPGSSAPNLALTADGRPVLSWLQPSASGTALRFAVLENNQWSEPRRIAEGNDWFVNWADFPSVVPIDERRWAAHWLRKSGAATYAYDVVFSISDNAGATWTKGQVLHNDGTATEHGFVSLFPWQGSVGAAWLDGRETLSDGPHAAMTLRSAIIGRDGEVRQSEQVDERICDCCQTDVALGTAGPLLVYRDRSTEEIRDISLARYVEGSWSEPVRVADDNWEINGCPVNGPAIAASSDHVAVAWFTAANEQPAVKLAFSADDGTSFSEAITLDGGQPIGRVDVLMPTADTAIVTWLTESGGDGAKIVAQRIGAAGLPGPRIDIAEVSAARLSGFPRQILYGDEIIIAFTDTTTDVTAVRTLRVPLTAFAP